MSVEENRRRIEELERENRELRKRVRDLEVEHERRNGAAQLWSKIVGAGAAVGALMAWVYDRVAK